MTFPLIHAAPSEESATRVPATSAGVVKSAGRVHGLNPLDHLLVPGDLPQSGSVRHAGSQGVHRDAVRCELDGELPDVGLEGRFRGGDRSVGGPHDVVAGRRHREDPRARREEAADEEVLRPVDERVAHHVDRHLQLRLRNRLLPRRREEGLQRPERKGVEENRDAALGGVVAARVGNRRDDLGALRVVGGVDVEELGLPAGRRDLGDDPVHVRLGSLPVEVDPENVPARPRERDRAGLAEARGGAENEGPSRAVFCGQNGADVSTAKGAAGRAARTLLAR